MVVAVAGLFDRLLGGSQGPTPLTEEAIDEARLLIAEDKPIQAIKAIREHTGMGLVEAKSVADAIAEGRPVPGAPVANLADRARELRDQDRIADAVRLVATETGMTEDEAARFIGSLD
ncbi:ribosomal L7/L12-like protein [Murinocardiopsis flavida]|uniref:Ribosomal L7/L12-like protein n=1 Tax=Murinocardiopsis flavida TaxID=645275 RepID=A0A2P8DF99_9ACTN|nr:ribosomal L7/L12-like protein [Murinocardiopsis flavida]